MYKLSLIQSKPAPNSQAEYYSLTAISCALLVIAAIWGAAEARLINDVAVWMKPFKFALSFALLFATLAIIERYFSDALRQSWKMKIASYIMAFCFLTEMVYLFFQASRGEASHFNFSTEFHSAMYVFMGVGAVTMIAIVAIIGWWAKSDPNLLSRKAFREGIWLGFALTFALTFVVAGYMSSYGGHFIGTHPEGGATIPLMGWSAVTGDLRPAHFASIHAMQFLPLIGFLFDRKEVSNAVVKVRWLAGAYCLLTLALFAQALAGLPVISLG